MRSCARRLGVESAVLIFVSVFVLYLSGCGGSTPAPPNPTSTPEHLYVTTSAGQILQFNLPLTNGSTPSVTVPTPITQNNFGLAVDANGNLAVADVTGNTLSIYHPPLTSSSTPAATFPNGTFASTGLLGFDSTGKLYVSGGATAFLVDEINIFSPAFSSASAPSQTLSISNVAGVDSSGNLYLDVGGGVGSCGVAVLAPPYTGTASTVLNQICVDGGFGRVVVANHLLFASHSSSIIEIITIVPLPGSTIVSGGAISGSIGTFTADNEGNLYVVNLVANSISVFAPPFSTNVPTVTIPLANVRAMAAGK